jgi:hypothetical protein
MRPFDGSRVLPVSLAAIFFRFLYRRGGPSPARLDSLMIHASTDIPMPSPAAISRYFFPDRSTACTSGVFHQFWYRRAGPRPARLDCLMIDSIA